MVTSTILHTSNNSSMSTIPVISKETLTNETETEVAFKLLDAASFYALERKSYFLSYRFIIPKIPSKQPPVYLNLITTSSSHASHEHT